MKKIVSVVALVMVMAFTAPVTAEEVIISKVEQSIKSYRTHKVMIIGEDYTTLPPFRGSDWIIVNFDIIDRSAYHIDSMSIKCFQGDEDNNILSEHSFEVKADFKDSMQGVYKILGPKEDDVSGVACFVTEYILK